MYNKVFLIGNLTKDPEMRYTTSGIPITRFTIAVNRGYAKENQQADFLRISTWRKLAEFCGEYLVKGRSVAVEGTLQINEYEKDGKLRTFAEIQADRVEVLNKKGDQSESVGANVEVSSKNSTKEEDIPF